jgi:hypothetical protein
MNKKLIFLLLLLGMVLAVSGQTIEQFQVPDVSPAGSGGVKFPSIASNSRGDIMVVFRNKNQSIMYYFKKKSNGAITQVALPGATGNDVLWTSTASTADDNFHAVWGIQSGSVGVYYADFDIASEKWNTPLRLFNLPAEDMHIRVNPLNNDIAVCTVLRAATLAKNIFVTFRKNGQTTWTDQINVSNQSRSATNPYTQFDEQGDLHVVYKEDRGDATDDLILKVALVKRSSSGTYSLVDNKWATSNYSGYHFLPSIAVTDNKGMMAFMWQQQAGYFYLPYERVGDALVFDQKNVTKIAPAPLLPQWMYWSKAVAHGDEIMFTYLDTEHKLKLLRWKNGQWLDSQPIALENASINKWPYNLYADPNIGLLAVWFIEDGMGDGHTYYCIYNYPKPTIRPPVDVTYEKFMERSFFHGYYMYGVKWADNPDNIEKNITVVKFNIYRRIKWGTVWTAVGSVAGDVFSYGDANGVTADSDFEYGVTAVNEKNVESRIQSSVGYSEANEKNPAGPIRIDRHPGKD